MGNFLIIFNEIAYLVLQHPEELPVSLKKIPKLRPYIIAALVFSGLCVGTGLYLLRTNYNLAFIFPVLAVTVVHVVFFLLWGVCLGALVDGLVHRITPDRAGHMWDMVAIAVFSCIPTAFFLPGAMTAKLLATPAWLAVPLLIALIVWTQTIVVRALRYLYELPLRVALRIYFRSLVILLAFPFFAILFFVLEFAAAAF